MDTQHSDFAGNQGAPPVDHEGYAEALTGRAREPREPEVDLDATSGAPDPERAPPRRRSDPGNIAARVRDVIFAKHPIGATFVAKTIAGQIGVSERHGSLSSTLSKLRRAGHIRGVKVKRPVRGGRPYFDYTVLNHDFVLGREKVALRRAKMQAEFERSQPEDPITSEGASPMDGVEIKGTKEPVADEVMLRRVSAYALKAADRFETLRKIEAELAAERAKPKLETATIDQCLDRIAAIRSGAAA